MTCCRMVGVFATDRERVACAMHELQDVLVASEGSGYGVAHYTDDALLLNRRPGVDVGGHAFGEFSGAVQSRVLVAHAFPTTEQKVQARDLHPFKYRNWAFGCTGRMPEGEAAVEMVRGGLLNSIPDFIRRDMKGHSCAEALFLHFLWRLHESGQLTTHERSAEEVARALRLSLDQIQGLATEAGETEPLGLNALTTDGQALYVLRRGAPIAESMRQGIVKCDLCYGEDGEVDSFSLRESHQRFRAVFIAVDMEDVPAGWKMIEEDTVLVVDETMELRAL
jgi:hypothetical protein